MYSIRLDGDRTTETERTGNMLYIKVTERGRTIFENQFYAADTAGVKAALAEARTRMARGLRR